MEITIDFSTNHLRTANVQELSIAMLVLLEQYSDITSCSVLALRYCVAHPLENMANVTANLVKDSPLDLFTSSLDTI